MTPLETLTPREEKLSQEVALITTGLPSEIVTQEVHDQAIDTCRAIKQKMAEVDAAYDDLIQEAHRHHKNLLDRKKKYWNPLKAAFDKIEGLVSAYRRKKEDERKQLELKLATEAKRQQEEQALRDAERLTLDGDHEAAEQVLVEAANAPAPVVVARPLYTSQSGTYSRNMPWCFEVIAPEKVKDDYWCPDLDAIAAIVKTKGDKADLIIGKGSIRVWRGTKTIIKA